jgi:hypothetical protein
MDDEVESVNVQRIDGGYAETPETRPAVIVSCRAFRQSEAGKIPGDSPEASPGEFAENLPVAERRAQHSVNAHDGLAVAFGTQEAPYTAGGEGLASIAVGVKNASCRTR